MSREGPARQPPRPPGRLPGTPSRPELEGRAGLLWASSQGWREDGPSAPPPSLWTARGRRVQARFGEDREPDVGSAGLGHRDSLGPARPARARLSPATSQQLTLSHCFRNSEHGENRPVPSPTPPPGEPREGEPLARGPASSLLRAHTQQQEAGLRGPPGLDLLPWTPSEPAATPRGSSRPPAGACAPPTQAGREPEGTFHQTRSFAPKPN